MKKLFVAIGLLIASLNVIAQAPQNFGDVKVNTQGALSDAALMDKIKEMKSSGQEVTDVTITGNVDGVCQAKGCWMTLKLADGESMTIKFKDYAFFMPMDCSGRKFVAHGKMFIKTTSVAELKHLAEDAGKTAKQIKKIKKPKKEVRFEADGVSLG